MVITAENIELTTRRLGRITIEMRHIDSIVWDDAAGKTADSGNISMMVLRLKFGCDVVLPASWTNESGEIQVSAGDSITNKLKMDFVENPMSLLTSKFRFQFPAFRVR